MFRISDLRHKDIVNSIDGKRLGYIKDVELDLNEGRIKAIILPGENRLFSLFGRNDDIVVDWQQVKKIGVDVVLVELPGFTAPTPKEEKEAEQLYENAFRKRERYQKKAAKAQFKKEQSEEEDIYNQDSRKIKSFGNHEERFFNPQRNKEFPQNDYYNPKAAEYRGKSSAPDDKERALEENNYNYYPPVASGKPKTSANWQDSPLWHSPPLQSPPKEAPLDQPQNPKATAPYADSNNTVSTPLKWGDESMRQEKNNLLGKWGDKGWGETGDWNAETDWSQPPPNWPLDQEKILKK